DQYGVEQSLELLSSAITANNADKTSYKVSLEDVEGLLPGIEYSVEFAKGYFEDSFSNDLEKTVVKFLNNSSEVTTTKLVATIGAADVDVDGRFINVTFDKTVDPTSATNKANYT